MFRRYNAGVDEHDAQQRVHETFFFYATGHRLRVYLFADEDGVTPIQRMRNALKVVAGFLVTAEAQVSRLSLFASKP